MIRAARALAAAALLGTVPGAAAAQFIDRSGIVVPPRPARPSIGRSAFARDRSVGVLDRMLPAFSANGLRVGPFDFFPGLDVATEYTSNLFADNARKHDDALLVVRPEGVLRTRGGPIDLDLYGRGRLQQALHYQTENVEEGVAGLDANAEVGPLASLGGGVSIGSQVLPRYAPDSPADARKPFEYRTLAANANASVERGRLRFQLRGTHERLDFHNTARIGGGTIAGRPRDRAVTSGLVRVDAAMRQNLSLYVAGSANRIDFETLDAAGRNRDSRGFAGYVGSSFDLGGLFRGDVRVGYLRQSYRAAGFRSTGGLGLEGRMEYSPTRLTTVTATAERRVLASGVPEAPSFVRGGGGLRVDHELRRYLLLGIGAGAFRDRFDNFPRVDRNRHAEATLTYLSRAHWNARAGYQYNRRRSAGTFNTPQFDDHRLLSSLTFQF